MATGIISTDLNLTNGVAAVKLAPLRINARSRCSSMSADGC